MKMYVPIAILLILTGCVTHGYGPRIGGGGSVHNGQDGQAVASEFVRELKNKGFDVIHTQTNSTIRLSFTKHSISGTAEFSPETRVSACIPKGYSYSYSVVDFENSWLSKRRLGLIPDLLRDAKIRSSNIPSDRTR